MAANEDRDDAAAILNWEGTVSFLKINFSQFYSFFFYFRAKSKVQMNTVGIFFSQCSTP